MFSVDSFDIKEPISLGQTIQDSWTKKKSQLDHRYVVTGWVPSVLLEFHLNIASELTGEHCQMM